MRAHDQRRQRSPRRVADRASVVPVRSMRIRSPDRRSPVTTSASATSPISTAKNHAIQGGMNSHSPGPPPGATLNSSRVAAATPRLARPTEITAEPVTTMSLLYRPVLAPPGTTSSSGIRADWRGESRTASPVAWTQDGGTSRPPPWDSRWTRTLMDSGWVPVSTT